MSLVMWSGGCDSTLVLYDLAQRHTKEKPVHALTVIHSSVPAQEEQARAREKIKKRFKKLELPIRYSVIEVNHLGDCYPTGMTQPMVWISHGVSMLSKHFDDEDFYTGHHKGDTMWTSWASYLHTFESMCSALEKKSEWRVPLMKQSKAWIIDRLREEDLYALCWWCEDPKAGRACGKCLPCKTHHLALYELKLWPIRNEIKAGSGS